MPYMHFVIMLTITQGKANVSPSFRNKEMVVGTVESIWEASQARIYNFITHCLPTGFPVSIPYPPVSI